jgi:hypothetical protein
MNGLQVLALILCAVGIVVGLMGMYSSFTRDYSVQRFLPLRPRTTSPQDAAP